jgi:putative FmdB family regulatory protein
MPSYDYRCVDCGPFVVVCPMGDAPSGAACPVCDGASRRVFSPPGVPRTPRAVARAFGRADASASEPSVVTR